MASSIENWAEMCGRVTSLRPSATRTNWVVIQLTVDWIADVDGYRNLLGAAYGPITIEAPARAAMAAGIHERVRLCCRAARRTRDLIVAHPDHMRVETQ